MAIVIHVLLTTRRGYCNVLKMDLTLKIFWKFLYGNAAARLLTSTIHINHTLQALIKFHCFICISKCNSRSRHIAKDVVQSERIRTKQ